MPRRILTLLGLMALTLGLTGCGSLPSDGVSDGQSLCSVHSRNYSAFYPHHFLHWTPDSSHLVFDNQSAVYAVDAQGTQLWELATPDPLGAIFGFYADVSPDSTQVVYATCEFTVLRAGKPVHEYEIAVINLDGTGQQRLTKDSGTNSVPSWSPDGSRIAFISEGYSSVLYTMSAVESNKQGLVMASTLRESSNETKEVGGIHLAPPVWSPDGERLAFLVGEGVKRVGYRRVLYTVRTDGTELTRIAEAVVPPVWSPDGEFLTFARASEIDAESGEWEEDGAKDKAIGIYTVRADGTDMQQVLAPQSAEWNVTQIALSPDGSELLIVSGEQALIVQADGTGLRSFEFAGHPEAWRQVAWSPDGSRIAVFVSRRFSNREPPQLYTIARDGTDRRDLIRLDDDGNLAPANPPQEGS